MEMHALASPRLRLYPMVVAHAEELYRLFQDSGLYTWIAREVPTDFAKFRDGIKFLESQLSRDGTEYWLNWVCRHVDTHEIIGKVEISLHRTTLEFNLAYTIFKPFQRQGYAREACLTAMDHVAAKYGAKKALIYMDVRNLASVALAESLGATRVEFVPRAQKIRDEWSDEYRYELPL